MTGRRRRALAAFGAVAVLGSVAFAAPTATAKPDKYTDIQLLAFNDFHGNLEPPTGSSANTQIGIGPDGKPVTVLSGGVEYLATHLKQARQGHQNTVTVAAGDLIGASPLLSAAFHDEPTVEAMEALGLDVTSVGNHEFDEGIDELRRIQRGGCHQKDGCADPASPYDGADYPLLGANVVDKRTGLPALPPVWVKNFADGARVGFIGMTLEGTGDIVAKEGVKNLVFKDEVATANFYAKLLKLVGVKSIVVLLHEGGLPASNTYNYNCDSPGPGDGISGPITDIAKNLDPQIDLVVTGHTHQSYVCNIPDPEGKPRMVTSSSSFGRLFTEINVTYDKRARDIVRTSVKASNKIVTRDVTKDAGETAIIAKYKTKVDPIANKKIGYITDTMLGRGSKNPESPLGDLIADSQLAVTSAADKGGAVIALMNPGGVRADLSYASSPAGEGDGVVTYGEAFTVQPFNNNVTTISLTGAQIVTVLQQQYSGPNLNSPKVLQPSAGFTYTVDQAKTGAEKIVVDSVKLNGVKLDPAAKYRVTVNIFLADGGDGFAELAKGTDRLVGGLDIDALVDWFAAHSSPTAPAAPLPANRITFI
ncbi:5'-nucleotidase [Actinorhabdospora filicis]|uniref:5'-nucleotidase n=1 Tax=Actinorhabdospora filicis TaxID=1785913 RepID=A0A9W6W747_9ACTN|nr:bifunctional metallophosphatase/5'-nucleotidase [Actinorhabdospora filicis]GLZ75593.1 5'-nucleotidase [Actinorhabdospora filicis]